MKKTYYVTGLYSDRSDAGVYEIPSQTALEARYRASYRSAVERGWEGMIRPVATLCDGESVGQKTDYRLFQAPRPSQLLKKALQTFRESGDSTFEAKALEGMVFSLSELPGLDMRLQELRGEQRVSCYPIPGTEYEVRPSEGLVRFAENIGLDTPTGIMLNSFAIEFAPMLDALPGSCIGGSWS